MVQLCPWHTALQHDNGFLYLGLHQDLRAHLHYFNSVCTNSRPPPSELNAWAQFEVMRECWGLGGRVSCLTFTADASTYSTCQYHSSSFCIAAHIHYSYTPTCMTYLEWRLQQRHDCLPYSREMRGHSDGLVWGDREGYGSNQTGGPYLYEHSDHTGNFPWRVGTLQRDLSGSYYQELPVTAVKSYRYAVAGQERVVCAAPATLRTSRLATTCWTPHTANMTC